jgi:HK97 gp10 family phage protein
MGMTVKVTGGRELVARFGRLSDVASTKALERAVLAGAQPILNEAKRRTPYITGTLRRSLHAEITSSSRHRVDAAVGTDVAYARRIELGFAGRDSRGRVFHQPPQPYLRPAFDTKRDAAIEAMTGAMRDQLRKASR